MRDRREAIGQSPRTLGYSHMMGGYAGASGISSGAVCDVGPLKLSSDLPDNKLLFLSTSCHGYMAAENCQLEHAIRLRLGCVR